MRRPLELPRCSHTCEVFHIRGWDPRAASSIIVGVGHVRAKTEGERSAEEETGDGAGRGVDADHDGGLGGGGIGRFWRQRRGGREGSQGRGVRLYDAGQQEAFYQRALLRG
jgi:hypothetical protein